MRVTRTSNGLRVHAVAGTYVVLFGFDMPRADCTALAGFAIHRVDRTENTSAYLNGSKVFQATDPGFPAAGAQYSTRDHPIQSFQWADYTAKPGHDYTYTVTARKGPPAALVDHASTTIEIATEEPAGGDHDVYFNRGVAASQAYAARFGNRRPEEVPNRAAFDWLSRGLYEALVDFVQSCVPGRHSLRVAAYEFHYRPFLQVLKDALDQELDIRIVYDARKASPRVPNEEAIAEIGLADVCTPRATGKSLISHNKFIVKLDGEQPIAVWTGGTNFSEGGIFGHSNVAHVVEDPVIASKYLAYWTELANDPANATMKRRVEEITPLPPNPPPAGTTAIFSPRRTLDALNWYAALAQAATEGLVMTFAFGMNDVFQAVYRDGQAAFRLALMEKKTRSMAAGPARDEEEAKIDALRRLPANTFAIGGLIETNRFDGWVKEKVSGLNRNVRYVHNKFMLIDPLSDDPIVVAGSANFSAASTNANDENMVVTRGNSRVADIYLGEFMRLYTHHAFRESLQWAGPDDQPRYLREEDCGPGIGACWWADYFGQTPRSVRRRFFARSGN